MNEKFTILGEVFERKHFPNIARMFDRDPSNTEQQIQSIANAWHEGSIVSAAIAFESDLGYK
ncbi:MAG: hypothetical protein A2481_02405 [Candidatus Yonathbacteria bacterium RIFOXYC2_FULL_47_9]|nr:MAG: hypothetical protein A2481_02405 [Candidatus Yonathbacteria bacterium RIFOXYC2_FULL_47_9]HAT68550.1 hypothetical protein [Candidatus Yonathbacteria bacterium]